MASFSRPTTKPGTTRPGIPRPATTTPVVLHARSSVGGKARPVDGPRLRRVISRLPSHGRTLVVDDNRFDLETLRIKLGMVLGPGVEIVTASGVTTALDKFKTHAGRFDLLLLNDRLGADAAGLALKRVLDRGPRPHDWKTVLYSAKLTSKLAQDAAAAGFSTAVHADQLDSMTMISEVVWRLVKPDIDWSASWRGLP